MIKKITLHIVLLITIVAFAQEKTVPLNGNEVLTFDNKPNGSIENGVYTCNLFNWKIAIPEGYKITDPKRTAELEKKGYDAMKDNVKDGVTINPNPTHLVAFELSKYNFFAASFEPLGPDKITIEDHKALIVQLLKDTYSSITVFKFDIKTTDIKLGKYDSYRILVHLYNAKTEQLILTQEMYNTFVGTNLFSASISFTDEKAGNLMSYNFISSFK